MKNNQGFSIIYILIVALFSIAIAYGIYYYFSQNNPKEDSTTTNLTTESACAKPEEFSNSIPKKLAPLSSVEIKKYENEGGLNAFDVLLFNINPEDRLLNLTPLNEPGTITIINTQIGYLAAYKIVIAECIDKLQQHLFEDGHRINSLEVNGLKFYHIDGWGHPTSPNKYYYLEIPQEYRKNPNDKYIKITTWYGEDDFEKVLRTMKLKPNPMAQ